MVFYPSLDNMEKEVDMSLAIDERRWEAYAEGYAEGYKQVIFERLHKLVDDGLISVEVAAEHAGVSVEEFQRSKK